MPTSVHINDELSLRIHVHSGHVGIEEIPGIVAFYRSHPSLFLYDVVQIVDESTVFEFSVEHLPALKADYAGLVDNARPPLIMRSAWVCASRGAWNLLEAWLHERQSLDGLHTEVCLVASLDEAKDVFEQDELRAVREMSGFHHCFST